MLTFIGGGEGDGGEGAPEVITRGVFDFTRRCADRRRFDIKVPRER